MANEIYGPYKSNKEAVTKAEILELKGHKGENITIFANKHNANALENRTDITIESDMSVNKTGDSFFDKIKKAVLTDKPDTNTDLHEKLVEHGISKEQAKTYKEEIELGNVLIVADDELKMGNDPTPDTFRMKEKVIQRHH
ncbi:general stress protein [Virgibacillus doumboii]|uniref:general stress protein n=1 Tax=Virgibacillus doumboii TaxID=2697503 RepID=UPI0013DEB238|nr:general stress protein [Virgibacillus doumboii]